MARARVLVVEDEAIVATYIMDILKRLGYEAVGHAATGRQAIEQAQALEPDLVLMDIRLQGEMDGIQASQAVRQRTRSSVIYITAQADTETVKKASATYPLGYLIKPFDENTIRATLEVVLTYRSMEKRLQESEERFRRTFEDAPLGMIILAPDFRILEVNRSLCDILGFSRKELLEGALSDITHPDDLPESLSLALQIAQGTMPNTKHQQRCVTKSGEVRWMQFSITKLIDSTSCDPHVLGMMEDITERKQAEEELKRREEVITQLSMPILRIGSRLLLLPLIGALNRQRARLLTGQLLNAIRTHRAKSVVLDMSGMALIDQDAANHLINTIEASRLLGARMIITGLSSDCTAVLVSMGVNVSKLNVEGDLQSGIEKAQMTPGVGVPQAH
ncbi:MAG: PAS domain S-box protein [SAR202 cluster bacterium]|nr:PAS domain S-box protein [SAR202 cluster bacterium]